MKYIDSILEPGEQVRYEATVSRTIYIPALVFAICGLAMAGLGAGYGYMAWIAAAALFLLAFVLFLPAWYRRLTTEIAVTDRRIIMKRGFIRRHTVEMNMQKVESVDVDQTLIGRIFDFGNITIRGTGSSFEKLANIDAPLKLRTTVTAG
jgi:uncharacterized membrane protein YdbT with pleckstrin-like domain